MKLLFPRNATWWVFAADSFYRNISYLDHAPSSGRPIRFSVTSTITLILDTVQLYHMNYEIIEWQDLQNIFKTSIDGITTMQHNDNNEENILETAYNHGIYMNFIK